MLSLRMGVGITSLRSGSALPTFDFTTLSAGAVALPSGLTLTRASSNDSVQTGTSTIATGLAANSARVGRRLDSDPLALVIEESRANLVATARATTGTGWTAGFDIATTGQTSPDATDVVPSNHATRLQTTSGVFSAYYTRSSADGNVQISSWMKATSSAFTSTTQMGLLNSNFALTTAWQRFGAAYTASGTYYITPQNAGGAVSQDALWDLFQIEQGGFRTEWIPESATRSADRLVIAKKFDSAGRVSVEIVFQPKGNLSAYAANPFVLRASGTDYVQINASTGVVSCAIGGSTYATPLGMAWSANDVVKLYIEFGGSVSTLVAMQVNSDPAVLLSTETPTALGAWSAETADLFGNSGSNVLSAWVRSIAFGFAQPEWV